MNDFRGDAAFCCFHPKEVLVGVCPFCLNEKLLVVASKQSHGRRSPSAKSTQSTPHSQRKPSINFPKIFAFGSLLNRLEFRTWKYSDDDVDHCSDHEASTSQEDSFISIKIEDNGVASWEKGTASKVSLENFNLPWTQTQPSAPKPNENKSVIEHTKSRSSLRWRKRIGHLFQLIRWKRSNKANARHVSSKVDGVRVRKGWIRSLTKRRTRE